MKGFERENQFLSLCGLNCGLCPMLLGRYCGGCGNGNQSCSIARCSIEHSSADTKIAYCYECGKYPCENMCIVMKQILLSLIRIRKGI